MFAVEKCMRADTYIILTELIGVVDMSMQCCEFGHIGHDLSSSIQGNQ